MHAPSWMPLVEDLKKALAVRDRDGAKAAVTKLLDAKVQIGPQWKAISELMRLSGELTLALRAMDAFVAAAAYSPQALYSKAVLLTQCGRMREAHDCVLRLPVDVPDRAGRAYVLGNTALSMGRAEEARGYFEESLRHRPGWGPAWLTLTTAVSLASDPLGEQLLAAGAAAKREGPGDLGRYFYAVGKLQADRREHRLAFEAFAKGAEYLRSEMPYSRGADASNARAAMTGWDDDLIERCNRQVRRQTRRAIFVTGLPRSGTTLVEQILTSHSEVKDGAELNRAHHLAVQCGGNSGQALRGHLENGASPDDLARLYLHLLDERFGSDGRMVDKTIDVSRFLGLIAAALPEAPLIWMRRDPLDSAWSCFRTFFIGGAAWSYDFADIAYHFRLEDELLAFWRGRLGKRLLVVPYPSLIDDPNLWTQRILGHCGLADEAGTHRPHATERVVMTASAMQVRKPINRDGINVAEPYRHHMRSFEEGYAELRSRAHWD